MVYVIDFDDRVIYMDGRKIGSIISLGHISTRNPPVSCITCTYDNKPPPEPEPEDTSSSRRIITI